LRTLIHTLIIFIAAASFSYAQETGGADARLIAKAETRDIQSDITPPVKNELTLGKDTVLSYDSPSLKAEDLPLVMSSPDRKTVSVVLPPFLYFKTQF